MAETSISIDESPPEKAVRQFLSAFGDPGSVKQELFAYWQQQGKLHSPPEIYAHLLDKRVESGIITSERAGILRAVFNDSFTPEHSTGYLAKHREPLVSGLAQLYAHTDPAHPVVKIEGDVSNLGGLNLAMGKSAAKLREDDPEAFSRLIADTNLKSSDPEAAQKLGRIMADRILHTICQFTLEELQKKSDDIIAVRKGGDEISFFAGLKNGVTPQDMDAALKKAQTSVAQLVKSAGLVIPHAKYAEDKWKSGVGIGLHTVDMQLHRPDVQQQLIAQGIPVSKEQFQSILHRQGTPEISVPDMKNVTALLAGLERYAQTPALHTVMPGVHGTGSEVPDRQRRANLEAMVKSAGRDKLNAAEIAMADGTHALVRKADFVTGLPLFENMQTEQLPYFLHKFGAQSGGAKLVNVDFSTIAGGNALSEGLGNHMIRAGGDVLLTAMMNSGLSEYMDSVSVRPGGKFALLVPAKIPDDKMADFALQLHKQLDLASKKPLLLDLATRADIDRKFTAADPSQQATRQALEEKYGAGGKQLKNAEGDYAIRIAQVVNPKSKLSGANVVMTYSSEAINPHQSLGEQLKPLEAQADKRQAQLTSYRAMAGMGFSERAKYQENALKR